MAYSERTREELINRIRNNPKAAVDKQLLIPADATRAIISKRLLGIFDRMDQQQLSAEILSAIKYIAEHDYLAFLMFIERYDLIRDIFFPKDLFAQQLARLDELEREKEHGKHQQAHFNEQERISALNKQQQEKLTQERAQQKLAEEKALINMELYQYFRHLEQGIHDTFHKKQIEILDHAYVGRSDRINRAIAIATNDPTIPQADKDALVKLKADYEREYQEVQRMPTHHANGAINHEALKIKADEALRVDHKYRGLFTGLMSKHPNQFAQIARQESEAVRVCEQALAVNRVTRDQQLEDIRPILESTRETVKADLIRSMDDSIDCLVNSDMGQLSEAEQTSFQNSLKQLSEYKSALSQTTDDEQIKDLSKKFTEELIHIKTLVKPSMLEPETLQKLENSVGSLSRLQNTWNTLPVEPIAHVSHVSEPPSYDDAVQNDPLPLYEEFQQGVPSTNRTSSMRDMMFFNRAQHAEQQAQIAPNSQQSVDSGSTVEFDDDNKELLSAELIKLQDMFKSINKQQGLSSEDNQLILESKQLCDEVSQTVSGPVQLSKMEALKENLDSLKINHSELNDSVEAIESIIDSIDNSPRSSL